MRIRTEATIVGVTAHRGSEDHCQIELMLHRIGTTVRMLCSREEAAEAVLGLGSTVGVAVSNDLPLNNEIVRGKIQEVEP